MTQPRPPHPDHASWPTTAALHLLVFSLLSLASCQVGPRALRVSQTEYSEAIQRANNEQLLLNLVRLKYRESPLMLDLGSVSAQFELTHTGSLSGTLNENVGQAVSNTSVGIGTDGVGTAGHSAGRLVGRNPDSLDLFGQVAYAERPTLTFTPLKGDEFVKRMMSPINLDTIVLLTNSGWRIDRVFRVAVQELNGLDNAGAASGPTPDIGPEFKEFAEVCDAMRALQLDRAIWLEYEAAPRQWSEPIPFEKVSPKDLVDAIGVQARFRPSGDGQHWALTKDDRKVVLRVAEKAASADSLERFRSRLHLAPDQTKYDLVLSRKNEGVNAAGQRTKIAVDTRSLLGVMFFLSQSVNPPDSHRKTGLVTQTQTKSGEPYDWSQPIGGFLAIRSAPWPPANAAVAVCHRGYWFYITDNDLNSKSTFVLLNQIFNLQAGSGFATTPLLTLPVGR